MAGNKNSGRRGGLTTANAEYRMSTIDECWKLVREAINNEELDYEYRVELASRHTVKSIPTELAGGLNATLTVMGTISKIDPKTSMVSEILKFNIGSPVNEPDPPQDS